MTTSKKRTVARPAATAEQRLRLLDAASRTAVLEVAIANGDPFDPRNRFIPNKLFREMFGITDGAGVDALGRLQASVDPRDRDGVNAELAAHIADRSGGTLRDFEYRSTLPGSAGRWLRLTICTERDAVGAATHCVCSLRDIHQEKASLDWQRAIEVRDELIHLASNVGFFDMSVVASDPVNPRNEIWWAPQFRHILGFQDENDFPNVVGSWSSRIHPDDRERVLTAFAAHLDDHSGKTPCIIDYRQQLKSGEYRWFRFTGASIRDPRGVPLRIAGALKNVHEEKEAVLAMETLITAAVDGDLAQRIAVGRYQGAMRSVGESMNRLLDSTSDSFRYVKGVIEQVGQASVQLRGTSQMMSQSSLQLNEGVDRSSSELARVAQGVKANADNAAMANRLVSDTSLAASGGEQRMEQMTQAMGAINGSSSQIARIIKVIDEIAFQTNLLALNAAVEAARAGRHGKGFAVVAQEVRSLAERSAKAAKETAELIEDSGSKVDQGVRIADSTRSSLREIVVNVTKVVDLAGEIASASGEQSRALASVTSSMRQATSAAQAGSQQSNEVAAAADELSRQMTVLRERMDRYKIPARIDNARGLPLGATPELVEQILQELRARSAA